MPMIDMHAHLLPEADVGREMRLAEEGNTQSLLEDLDRRMGERGVDRALVYLLDERVFEKEILRIPPRLALAVMINFRRPYFVEIIKRARERGAIGVKILTYEQEITVQDYPALRELAGEVERQDMFLTICSTFGSKKLYAHDAIGLASHLLQEGFSAPLIMAHGGGSRARDVFLLMDDAANVYVDTSFTTTYWRGSAVIDELAYMLRRFPARCFFGSDTPYVPWEEVQRDAKDLLMKLPEECQEKLLYVNAALFLRRKINDRSQKICQGN